MSDQATHQEFLGRLKASDFGRWVGAMILVSRGHCVTVPPNTIAPDFESRGEHDDGGDLIVYDMAVEIKHLGCDFTCHDDWPFRDYIVASINEIDNHKPRWIITLNRAATHYGLLTLGTKSQWWKKSVYDKNRPHPTECYACNVALVQFFKVDLA